MIDNRKYTVAAQLIVDEIEVAGDSLIEKIEAALETAYKEGFLAGVAQGKSQAKAESERAE